MFYLVSHKPSKTGTVYTMYHNSIQIIYIVYSGDTLINKIFIHSFNHGVLLQMPKPLNIHIRQNVSPRCIYDNILFVF